MHVHTRFALALAAVVLLSLALPSSASAQWTNRYPQAGGGHQVYLEGYELPTLTSGPMDPVVSPDGSTVAVASEGWLWLVEIETRVATQFTDGGAMDSRPAWSPDGSELVFLRDDGADTWIAAKSLETGDERVVVNTPGIELDPSVGPDGSIWYSSGEEGRIEVWHLDAATGERTKHPTRGRVSRSAQISPDGRYLLIKENVDRVVVRDLVDSTEVLLHEGNIMSQMEPALSPDGRRVAWQVPQAQGDGWELRLASIHRPGTTVMLAGGGDRLPLAPAWSPDGEWIWFSEAGRDEVMRLYRVPATGGAVEEIEIEAWEYAGDRGHLRVTTRTAGSDGPVAARMSVLDANGHPLVPPGHQARFDGQTGTVFFYTDGVLDMEVPAGEVTVSVARGLAAPVETATLPVQAGTRAGMDVELQPVWNARAAGWMSGDQHFHLNYGGPYRLEPGDLDLMLAGEELDVATPLVANLHERFGEQPWFGWGERGEAPLVRFGQEVRSHFLGHIGLIGTDELFWPWVWGPGYEVYGQDDRTNAEVTAHARAQGGLASYVHPSGADPFANPAAPGLPVELVADGVLGDVQALEVACLWTDEVGTAEVWYHLLNLGHPVAATSGSDVMLDFYRTMAPGATRTYVHTGDASDFDTYLEGLKAGRSFVSNGPLVQFTVDGAMPGDVTPADGGAAWSLRLHSAVDVDMIDVIVNGEVVESISAGEGAHQAFDGDLDLPDGGWVALRVTGPATTAWPGMDSYAFAHTSPVWIGGVGSVDAEAEARSAGVLIQALDGARAQLEAGYRGSEIPNLSARFDEARAVLEALVPEESGR
ncbi:MAG TPA: CehA/McbA family metallohydrolase [Longimicrobiales bacterium]|nr:CehA/McbA family metallohydrolase [Longimicrobiales bacterium]